MPRESLFERHFLKILKQNHPNSIILKNDPTHFQGIPDRTILFSDGRWAVLEFKKSRGAPVRVNQKYWVEFFNNFGYSAFVYPENSEEILNDLQQTFAP